MAKQATSAQSINQSSLQANSVFVFGSKTGLASVAVPDGATVDYVALAFTSTGVWLLSVWIDDTLAGWHCGERTGRPVAFSRKSDAVRLADTRNAVWASRRSVKEVA